MKLYLGSNSPRRAQLLNQISVSFDKLLFEVDESVNVNELPEDYCTRVTRLKMKRALQCNRMIGSWVLTSDTCVAVDNTILGKASGSADAEAMLLTLSDGVHRVLTNVCLSNGTQFLETQSCTRVWFDRLSSSQIKKYLKSDQWQGCAGAYAIQGLAGYFVKKIEGSFTGVVGLPLYETYQLLIEAGFDI